MDLQGNHPRGQVIAGALPPVKAYRLKRAAAGPDMGKHFRPGEMGIAESCELVERYSPPGGNVLDLTAGTCPIGLACLRVGRAGFMVDKDGVCLERAKIRCMYYHKWLRWSSLLTSLTNPLPAPPTPQELKCAYLEWVPRFTTSEHPVPYSNRPLKYPESVEDDATAHNLEVINQEAEGMGRASWLLRRSPKASSLSRTGGV